MLDDITEWCVQSYVYKFCEIYKSQQLNTAAHSDKGKWKVKYNCSKSQSDVGKETLKRKTVTVSSV